MGAQTSILWTDHTFNPVWGCTKVDPGCANCYAETLSKRYGHDIWGPKKERRLFGDKHWNEPLRWNKTPARVFCGSMCDWAEDHPTTNTEREKLWHLIRNTPNLTWQLLTKRADRIQACLPFNWPLPNVWLGVSISESGGLWRAEHLRKIPRGKSNKFFISYEPALGDISDSLSLTNIDWVVFGGESGAGFRSPPGWIDWAHNMRRRCRGRGVAFFFKQSPGIRSGMNPVLGNEIVQEFPQ